jgi:type VI secretion system protein ImpB
MIVLGKFNPFDDYIRVQDMKPIRVNGNNLDDVLNACNIVINFTRKDEKGNNIDIRLPIKSISDFSPNNIVKNVTSMSDDMDYRNLLIKAKNNYKNQSEDDLLSETYGNDM